MKPYIQATGCCALGQLRASNGTSLIALQALLSRKREEGDSRDWAGTPPDAGGQTALFCVTTPDEQTLEDNLRELGFDDACTSEGHDAHPFLFPRRKGYPAGDLTLWLLVL
jgi:hypothetical protein